MLNLQGNATLDAALILLVIAAAIGVVFGIRYLTARAYMPYQAAVAGKPWTDIEPRLQAVILAMMRIIGGAFACLGVAVLCLCVALCQGCRQAPWAILVISAVLLAPTLYAAVSLRTVEPTAKTPVVPTLAAIVLIVVGAVLALVAVS